MTNIRNISLFVFETFLPTFKPVVHAQHTHSVESTKNPTNRFLVTARNLRNGTAQIDPSMVPRMCGSSVMHTVSHNIHTNVSHQSAQYCV